MVFIVEMQPVYFKPLVIPIISNYIFYFLRKKARPGRFNVSFELLCFLHTLITETLARRKFGAFSTKWQKSANQIRAKLIFFTTASN